jgi:N-acetylmuramoyl-L-alanine amidase
MRLRTVLSFAAAGALLLPATAAADFPHVVAPGETLTSVAAIDGLSIDQIAAANGISPDTELVEGTMLLIPPQSAATAGESAAEPGVTPSATAAPVDTAAPSEGSYLVQPGDTLSAIAARAGTTVEALAAANALDPAGILLSGSVLQLDGASSAGSGETATATQPVGAPAEGSAGDPPYPTPETVSAPEIGSIAAANGVPASLAEAIGWQESGFDNDLTSVDDARGVMQILPGTWNWIGSALAGPVPLAPASAASNVRGGVLLLKWLLDNDGGDEATAAAGYYQGLPSVEQDGEYSSTQQYVADVQALQARFGGP